MRPSARMSRSPARSDQQLFPHPLEDHINKIVLFHKNDGTTFPAHYNVVRYDMLLPLDVCWFVGARLPICIIVLKVTKVNRECQDSGVVVEAKIIIGSLNPVYLLRSELRQPGWIKSNQLNLPDECKTVSRYSLLGLFFVIPRFEQTSS